VVLAKSFRTSNSPSPPPSPKGRGRTSFDLSRLRASLRPFRLYWYPRLSSTNTHAAALRRARKLFAPAVVLTGRQIAGRGRGSNSWWSGTGSLTVTFVLPVREHLLPHQVPLVAGLTVRNAVARVSGVADVQLKWPNDLLYQGRKLAGLLCERLDSVDLIGLGMNVNIASRDLPASLRPRVTSLLMMTGRTFDLTELLATIAQDLLRVTSQRDEPPFAQLLREYDQHHALAGRRVSIPTVDGEPPVSGICEGLDREGRLLVRTRRGLERVVAGHVTALDPRG
jgi:BirA family biotin operon repressor/biotin-[acetyl-CoA-carboxylase] ligase